MARILITGGAGFIGSHLTAKLLKSRHHITVVDNLSSGRKDFLKPYIKLKSFRFHQFNLLNLKRLKSIMAGHDVVFHMAANSDISLGARVTDTDLNLGTLATYNVLEAMRHRKVKKIIFASTSAIYGDAECFPTPEDYGPLLPISYYGASKLACEGLISAYCHNYGMKAWIYRFANVIGSNPTHGAIYDFVNKLKRNSKRLEILGNGAQRKPYLHVEDCVQGMLYGYRHAQKEVNYFNLTSRGAVSAREIGKKVINEMGLKNVRTVYTGGNRGWRGDVPYVRLAGGKMRRLGWQSKLNSRQALNKAVGEIVDQLS